MIALLLAVDAALQPFVKVDAKAVVLEHVRVIDGRGSEPREDQSLAIVDGRIAAQAPAVLDVLSVETRARLLANHLGGRAPEMIVFKDGVGYDPPKLAESVRGLVGIR